MHAMGDTALRDEYCEVRAQYLTSELVVMGEFKELACY
jgi:hypothetical protein